MANLRDMLDGKTLENVGDLIAATASSSKGSKSGSKSASPLAKHISERMQDPVGATKDDFGALSEAKLNYDMAREKTQRNLAPVQAVITHLSQMHNLDPNQMPMPGGMDPNDPMADQNGGQNMFQDEQGNPVNMGNTAGKMNSTRPSLVGNQPGVAPGDGQTVRPPKLGQAKPGGPGARNSPAPGNAQGNTYNKTAAKPAGNRSIPGAKGPGDSKNVSKNRKAQSGTTGRQIKVNVSAQALDIMASASYANQESSLSLGVLKTGSPAIPVGTVQAMMMPSRGAGGGGGMMPRGGVSVNRGGPVRPVGGGIRLNAKKKKMEAGPAALADKVTDNSGDNVAYNPVIRSKSVGRPGFSKPRPKGSGAKPHNPGIAGPSGKNFRLPRRGSLKEKKEAALRNRMADRTYKS